MVYNFPEEAHTPERSSASAVIVMQSTQDWQGEDLAIISIWKDRSTIPFWNLLVDALMWPGSIEVLNIGMKDAVQLLLVKDEQVIETLSSYTSQKAFTDRIGAWCVIRRDEHLDAARVCDSSETGSKLAVMITDEILRRLPIGSCLPQLLSGPGVSWRSRHPDVDNLPRFQFNDEKRKERTEAKVGHLQEITGPDLPGMSAQEGRPALPS